MGGWEGDLRERAKRLTFEELCRNESDEVTSKCLKQLKGKLHQQGGKPPYSTVALKVALLRALVHLPCDRSELLWEHRDDWISVSIETGCMLRCTICDVTKGNNTIISNYGY